MAGHDRMLDVGADPRRKGSDLMRALRFHFRRAWRKSTRRPTLAIRTLQSRLRLARRALTGKPAVILGPDSVVEGVTVHGGIILPSDTPNARFVGNTILS